MANPLERFKAKIGPLPVWAWGLIIGGLGIAVYYIYKSRSTANTVATVDNAGSIATNPTQAADQTQAAADTSSLWDQITSYIAGLGGPGGAAAAVSAPPVGASAAQPASGYSYVSASGGGGGSAIQTPYAPASVRPPIVGIGKGVDYSGPVDNGSQQAPYNFFGGTHTPNLFDPGIGSDFDNVIKFSPLGPAATVIGGISTLFGSFFAPDSASAETLQTGKGIAAVSKSAVATTAAPIAQITPVRADAQTPVAPPVAKAKAAAPVPKAAPPAPTPAPKTTGKLVRAV